MSFTFLFRDICDGTINGERVEKIYEKGEGYMGAGQFHNAIDCFTKLIVSTAAGRSMNEGKESERIAYLRGYIGYFLETETVLRQRPLCLVRLRINLTLFGVLLAMATYNHFVNPFSPFPWCI